MCDILKIIIEYTRSKWWSLSSRLQVVVQDWTSAICYKVKSQFEGQYCD